MVEADWDEYLVAHSDPDVVRFVGNDVSPAFIRRRFDKLMSQYPRGSGHLGTFERSSGRLLGGVGLLDHDDWTATPVRIEIGWLIRKDAWNRGYATEAARAVLRHAAAAQGLERVICIVDPRNIASRRVAEKLGLELAGETIWRDFDVVWYEGTPGA